MSWHARLGIRPPSARVTDQIHLGAFARFFPPQQVEQILVETGRQGQRLRQLPDGVMVYYVIAMALWRNVSCREVLRCLLEGLSPIDGVQRIRRTARSAISMARARLGPEPLRRLLESCVKPIATAQTRGAWYRGLRRVSLDGSSLDVADTPANAQAFGRPGASRGDSADPKLSFVSLLESGTHVGFRTAWGGFREGETTLATRVLEGLSPGMRCFADRGFFGFALGRRRGPPGPSSSGASNATWCCPVSSACRMARIAVGSSPPPPTVDAGAAGSRCG